MFRCRYIILVFVLSFVFGISKQECPAEVSHKLIPVKWPASQDAVNVFSEPICYSVQNRIVTRNCSKGEWSPPLNSTTHCAKVVSDYELESCPPGFHKISENSTDFCYQVTEPSKWDFPCLKSGGASTITDLSSTEVNKLVESLEHLNVSQYYWLPARRQKLFNPTVWTIPGPNWIKEVEGRPSIPMRASILKNCLLLDVLNKMIVTEKCHYEYPSLCFYVNDVNYPAKCPQNYQSFRFMLDDGTCFGVENTSDVNGATFNDFITEKCEKPMGNNKTRDISVSRYLYKKMVSSINLENHEWCWFSSLEKNRNNSIFQTKLQSTNISDDISNFTNLPFRGIINKYGSLGIIRDTSRLPCMACEKEIVFGESELNLEYHNLDKKMYLTVYEPSELWKYNYNDEGVRCFSNAKGFPQAVNIYKIVDIDPRMYYAENYTTIEKIVYVLASITDRMSQYWCEGHTKKLSLISTDKVIANPYGDSEHVFALTAKVYHSEQIGNLNEDLNLINVVTQILIEIFDVEKVVAMDILDYNSESAIILFHIHIIANFTDENETILLQDIVKDLEETATANLSKHNIELVSIASAIYCFPTKSEDSFTLEWELTPIGQIAAPKQFCLQKNGLPVQRKCGGSYLQGAKWGPVEGTCDSNYQPSNTTHFLYTFVKGLGPESWTKHFLTFCIRRILEDIDIIIPADIYYLSKSLKQISEVARTNRSSLDMGDLENIAWIVDHLMILNNNYLNLAQTLNSTNVILDAITDLIEILALPKTFDIEFKETNDYQLAVEPQFISQISYPWNNNISGLALIKNKKSDLFTDAIIQPLYTNSTLNNILQINNLVIATWLPQEVLDNLSNNTYEDKEDDNYNLHILINVFYNDAIFQEINENNQSKHLTNSHIIEIKIPGFQIPLDFSIPLVFKSTNITRSTHFCGYWNFESGQSSTVFGQWKKRGCYMVTTSNELVVCRCYHLTHFTQLISWQRRGDDSNSTEHSKVLNIITLFGSFLSLLGIAGIWVTALVFSMWRKKAGTKVLLQLSTALAFPLILIIFFSLNNNMFIIVNGEFIITDNNKAFCIGLGAFLHYSILAGFVWMLISAILQFIRYVRVIGVRRPSRFMIKMSIVGWGLPIIPVIIVLILNRNTYIPSPVSATSHNSPLCYPNGIYFLLAVLLPVGIIVVVNIILFVCVMVSIAKGPNGKVRSPDLELVKAQLRLSIFLFFLLGLTWIFGIFSFSKNYVWSYMFCLTSTIQGFVLFVYFIICDPATRNLWITLMKPQFRRTESRVSITSISNSSQ